MNSTPSRLVPVLFVLVSIARAQVGAPSTNYVLSVTADRPGAIYKKGETVTFTIKLLHDKQPVSDADVSWILTKDGVPPTTNGKAKLAGGTATVTGKLDEPGFLQCRVGFAGPDKLSRVALGGAAIDPLQIKPSLPVPDDFDAFWAGQKKKLAAVPVNPRLTPEKSPVQGVDCFDLQADCVGAPVSGYFARPAGAKPKSLPAILLVHGAGVRSSSLGAAAGWAKEGLLALDINAHGIPNGKPEQFYTDLRNGELKEYTRRGRESRDTVYFFGMFLRLVRALDFLTAQPEWDGRTVVVHGSSQGGYQSLVAAGLDPRVTFFAAGVPAGCDHTGYAAGRVNGWPKFIAPGEKPAPNVLEAVRYYDAVNFAARTKAAGIVTVGFIDTTCPPTTVYAAYNALRGKKQIFNDVPSGHRNSPQASEAMRQAILAHVEAMKKQAPRS
ncbi:MAG: acetylxylan esterase [Verrucomicrobia bacterium]|nr:acetylxylan esterase [Verrucomicrobiota bacterium]